MSRSDRAINRLTVGMNAPGNYQIIYEVTGDEGESLERTPTIHQNLEAKHQSPSPNSPQTRAQEES